jgi:hypothetical protein
MPKYPITVKLIGKDGNAFNLIGLVSNALRKAKAPKEEVRKFQKEAMSGDYDNVLITCMDWVNVT